MSIIRVGLSETDKFSAGWDAIFRRRGSAKKSGAPKKAKRSGAARKGKGAGARKKAGKKK